MKARGNIEDDQQKEVLTAKNEFMIASCEIKQAKEWANTISLNLNELTIKASTEMSELRFQLIQKKEEFKRSATVVTEFQ